MVESGPVSVVVRHRVKPGKENDFEAWLRGISRAALAFTGHMGFHIVRPTDPTRPEYTVFFRFDSFANLEQWEGSDARREWMDRLAPLVLQAPTRERHTGMEVWFTPQPGQSQPPRYKMVVVTLMAIYPLILAVQLAVVPRLASWPIYWRTLATAALLVCLMTYGAMPLMTRLFSKWLYGASPAASRVRPSAGHDGS